MTPEQAVSSMIDFIDRSPSPYHACETSAELLQRAGFARLATGSDWAGAPERAFVVRGGSLVAWDGNDPAAPLRLVGAHTDSPNLRIKPRPDVGRVGYRQLGVEVYGSALLNSWLDRDLGLSGRVAIRGPDDEIELRLVRDDRPLLRVPQLAIHLDRGITDKGLNLNRQLHMAPLWATGSPTNGEFRSYLSERCGGAEVLAWDIMCHDLTPSTTLGAEGDFVAAPRIDNLASCWAAVHALISSADAAGTGRRFSAAISLYDHEEVGSVSATGADGAMLASTLERRGLAGGGDRAALLASLAGSLCLSADGAHATHPNYPDRHEPTHQIRLNGGPVIKMDANERYATDAASSGAFKLACERAGVPVQEFVSRTDLPCGSTIGPATAATLGVATADVGLPQLSMHSARELCGVEDPAMFLASLEAFLSA